MTIPRNTIMVVVRKRMYISEKRGGTNGFLVYKESPNLDQY